MMSDQQADKHFGETKPVSNHAHDLIHDLNKRLDAVWRYDQYVTNAEKANEEEIAQLWKEAKQQDMELIERMRTLLKKSL